MKYGLRKIPAKVSTKKTIRCDNRIYHVTVGADTFSSHKSTPVKISRYHDKLFIFEPADNGILLGEAMPITPPEYPVKSSGMVIEKSEFEQIIAFLEHHAMTVDRTMLIETQNKGLSLDKAKDIFSHNQNKYMAYRKKMNQPDHVIGMAIFNAFILDCQAHHRKMGVAPYAIHGDV